MTDPCFTAQRHKIGQLGPFCQGFCQRRKLALTHRSQEKVLFPFLVKSYIVKIISFTVVRQPSSQGLYTGVILYILESTEERDERQNPANTACEKLLKA